MFNWRRVEAEDYQMLTHWWSQWGWPCPPAIDHLPNNGVMVYDVESGTPLYAAFLYETGTKIGWLEYIISNKHADSGVKRGAKEYLIETISTIAKYRGINCLFTSTNDQMLVNTLKKSGFKTGDTGVTQMIKLL